MKIDGGGLFDERVVQAVVRNRIATEAHHADFRAVRVRESDIELTRIRSVGQPVVARFRRNIKLCREGARPQQRRSVVDEHPVLVRLVRAEIKDV